MNATSRESRSSLATRTGVPRPSFLECRSELGAPVERVRALAGLDLDQLACDREPVDGSEGLNRLSLRLEPEPASALPRRAHPEIAHRPLHRPFSAAS
jgi:hypothetical protein